MNAIMRRVLCISLAILLSLVGCASMSYGKDEKVKQGNENLNYDYQPVGPFPVTLSVSNTTDINSIDNARILSSLSNEKIQLSLGEISESGKVEFTVGSVAYEGQSYIAILDYIKHTTLPVKLIYTETVSNGKKSYSVIKAEQIKAKSGCPYAGDNTNKEEGKENVELAYKETIVPVHVGVGLRMKARFTVQKGSGTIDVASFFGIGSAAEAGKIKGDLTIEALGISGEAVSPVLPLPSKIDISTIQQAIQSLASIRAILYSEKDNVTIIPKIVSFDKYNDIDNDDILQSLLQSYLFFRPDKYLVYCRKPQ